MGLTYFKRYRMEFDLAGPLASVPALPAGYAFEPWHESLLELHAETKYRCFCEEIDAYVLPSLSQRAGCLRLMRDITSREGFLPEATWLLRYNGPDGKQTEYCGTIQGVLGGSSKGYVQNVGIVPEHRGRSLGTCLLCKALEGFFQAGARRVSLDVTASNRAAIRLYRRLGFRRMRVLYKVVNVAYA